jgi:Short C-terminal domain
MQEGRLRRISVALIVVATVIGFFAVFAVWAKRQALETDTWTETSAKVLADQDVQDALSIFLVDALYDNVDVEGQIRQRLPPQAKALAGPVAGGLRQLADRAAHQALQDPRVQQAFSEANSRAHAAFLNLIEGGGETVSTTGGDVTLNLDTIVAQLGSRTGVDIAGKLPPQAAEIVLIHSDELSFAQDLVNLLRKLAYILPFVSLGLYALAIYLARGARREAVRASGIGFIVIGIAVLLARGLAGDVVVNSLASTDAVEPAVQAVWSIGTSLLKGGGVAMIGYGVVIVLGAWLAGSTAMARSWRRAMTPLLRERRFGYLALGVIILLAFWWSPTEGFRRLAPSLVLIALLIAGFEGLRRQALRDFPDETWDRASERWRTRRAAMGTALSRGRGSTSPDAIESSSRIADLERLARLHDSGVLSASEFAAEKQRLLQA